MTEVETKPWRYELTLNGQYNVIGPDGTKLATVHGRHVNARLIAAAPDMLAALQAQETALAHLETYEPDMDPIRFREVVDELFAQAEQLSRAAIAKAEGR